MPRMFGISCIAGAALAALVVITQCQRPAPAASVDAAHEAEADVRAPARSELEVRMCPGAQTCDHSGLPIPIRGW